MGAQTARFINRVAACKSGKAGFSSSRRKKIEKNTVIRKREISPSKSQGKKNFSTSK